ncbi:MAG: response regulator, partial [Bacteroidetes bacterium]|nr:response regulator [Bacteroidota bacterium]
MTIIGPTDTTCEVIGFTIRGGSGTYRYYTNTTFPPRLMSGGGVILQQAGARIAHNVVTKNFLKGRPWAPDAEGAGILASDTTIGLNIPSYVIIEYNTVIGNEASGQSAEGAGIELFQPGIIRHNIVMHNRAFSRTRSFAGGIYVGMTAEFDVVVDGNYIAHNVAGIGGGMLVTALYTRHGRAIITNNIIAENRAFEVGGAANVAEQTYAVFLNNTIVANRALSTGGGINVTEGSHVVLVNNILWGNKADQVSEWGIVQAIQNDVEGGLVGKGNFNADPRFIPGDTLFRLDPNSPCIGAGMKDLRLADRPFLIPGRDLSGSPRIAPASSNPDMGATESPWGDEDQENQGIGSDGYLKFTVMFKQITEVLRNKETGEIIKAGEMLTTLVVNDSTRMVLDRTTAAVPFILSPGNNLLAVEVVTRARDSSAGLNAFIWLEGTDRRVSVLYRRYGLRYQHYSELRPGEYTLVVQPQDESSIIGHTNRVSVAVVVPPFWYQRWWAYSLYAFAVLSIAFMVYRVRMKRLRLEYETSRLSELDRMKSRFFANLSHEFRTPLSLILGPVDQLETSEPQSGRKEQLGLIRRNAERLLRMVNLLLQFSRIEAGTLKLHVSLQPIPQLLRRIVSSFSTAAVKKG